MAAKKGRSPVAASITQDSIKQANTALADLPEKPKTEWSLREAINQLQGTINTALERGYSHQEVADMLGKQGIRISPASLRSYLAASNRNAPEAAPKRRRTAAKVTVSEDVAAIAPPPEPPAPEVTPAPKKTRSSKTVSKAKAPAPKAEKTATPEAASPRPRRRKATTATKA